VTRVTFAQACEAYLKAAPHRQRTKDNLRRLLLKLNDRPLLAIDQGEAERLRDALLPAASPATFLRSIITPLRAVLSFAADPKRGWCDPPRLGLDKAAMRAATRQARVLWLTPDQATRLVAGAAPHLRPLLVFLLCTGARLSEALELDWRDVDLAHARAEFLVTKNGKPRFAGLPPTAIAVLANLPHRDGRVFLRPVFERRDPADVNAAVARMAPYADQERYQGGQIRRSWATACKAAGIEGFTPHDLRHTWATWRYCVDHDLLRLRDAGGWSSLRMVERYAHLAPDGLAPAIRAWWGLPAAGAGDQERRVVR
jgi:integrase